MAFAIPVGGKTTCQAGIHIQGCVNFIDTKFRLGNVARDEYCDVFFSFLFPFFSFLFPFFRFSLFAFPLFSFRFSLSVFPLHRIPCISSRRRSQRRFIRSSNHPNHPAIKFVEFAAAPVGWVEPISIGKSSFLATSFEKATSVNYSKGETQHFSTGP